MENASKALLMAGGVLIAIITLTLLVKIYGNISLFQKVQLTEEEQAQLLEFNEQYTKYLGQYVYGTEVITVINKTLSNQTHKISTNIIFLDGGFSYKVYKYKYDESSKKIKKEEETKSVIAGKELNITNEDNNIYDVFFEDNILNNRAFKCTQINYDEYGRVNYIKFEEKKWEN